MSEGPQKQQRPKALWFGLAIRIFIASIFRCLIQMATCRKIYQQSGQLVRVVPVADTTRIEVLNQSSLLYELDQAVDLTHVCEKRDGQIIRVEPYPKREYLEALLSAGTWPTEAIPRIRGVSVMPFFNKDGEYVQVDGYDSVSQIYLARSPWGKFTLKLEQPPTPEQCTAYRLIIMEMLADFPFVSKADIANCYALLVTLFARELFTGPSPLFYIGAGKQGTGKDLLASALTMVYLGKPVETLPPTRNEEELRKRMTSLLMSGQRVCRIGNQTKSLESASLAAFLTSESWTDRELGGNRMCVLENTITTIVTANNLQCDADLVRRICAIRIEADCERPEERTGFKHDPLLEYCKEKGRQLAGCVNHMIRKWILDGRPLGKIKMGSFESWSEVVGGILEANGVTDFLGNLQDIKLTSEDDAESEKCLIIEGWFRFHFCEIVQSKDVRTCIADDRIPNLLSATSDSGKNKQFGHVLRGLVGAVYRGFTVSPCGADHSRVKKYRLITKPEAIDQLDIDMFHLVLDKILNRDGSIDRTRMAETLMPDENEVDKVHEAIERRLKVAHPDKPYIPNDTANGNNFDDIMNA